MVLSGLPLTISLGSIHSAVEKSLKTNTLEELKLLLTEIKL